MPETFEGQDLSGARFVRSNLAGASFEDVNLAGASLENVNLAGARIRDASLAGLVIEDAHIPGLTVDGFDVSALIAAEMDRRDPERVRLRFKDRHDPVEIRLVLAHLDELRGEFIDLLRAQPVEALTARPEPREWSALEVLRHMLFAEQLYLDRWIVPSSRAWIPFGLLPHFLASEATYAAAQTQACEQLEPVLAAWQELNARMGARAVTFTADDLRRDISAVSFGQPDVGAALQTLAGHDLTHIRQAEAALRVWLAAAS